MVAPTKEEVELLKKYDSAKDEKEKIKILNQLREEYKKKKGLFV